MGVGRGTDLVRSHVYGFAIQSGGDVFIESAAGEGTTITIMLPCSDKQAAAGESSRKSRSENPALVGRILVVDDNADVCAFDATLLGALRHQVVPATTRTEELSTAAGSRVDGAVEDNVIPGTGGLGQGA